MLRQTSQPVLTLRKVECHRWAAAVSVMRKSDNSYDITGVWKTLKKCAQEMAFEDARLKARLQQPPQACKAITHVALVGELFAKPHSRCLVIRDWAVLRRTTNESL
jgi:hypothetical protein